MKCFMCQNEFCRTTYPSGAVQKVCDVCGWKSNPVKIPVKIPSVKVVSLEKRSKSNLFDIETIYDGR